jgi:hypothetical protein
MPDGLEDTKRFLIPVESTTVSVNDEEPETLTVTDVEAVWLVLSVTLTVYAVVVAGFATGLARVGSLNEAVGLHAKLYGGAPPVAGIELRSVPGINRCWNCSRGNRQRGNNGHKQFPVTQTLIRVTTRGLKT